MRNRFFYISSLILPLLILAGALQAQTEPSPIKVDFSDLFEYTTEKGQRIQKLLGSVELRQDSVFMYCDSALIFNEIDVIALGRVIIQQGDSLSIFADSLFYQGAERIADLSGQVILSNRNRKLFTSLLNYDLNTRIATYEHGALFTNDTTQLTSKRGNYDVAANMIYFKDSVQIVDPNFELRTDTLAYNAETQIAIFLAPTLIVQDSARIYCEGGYYDIANQIALFSDNPQYLKGETKANADLMRYDGKEKKVSLQGNASFEEPGRRAYADAINYFEETEEIFLSGGARYESEDQLILADTIAYDRKNEIYATRGRSLISDPPYLIEADRFDYKKGLGIGLALGNVIWQDTSAGVSIFCEQANYRESGDYLKAFGGRQDRPLLISRIDGDSLYMTADTLIAERQDTLASDSTRLMTAFHQVRIFKTNLQALCDSLAYSTADSIFRLFDQPIIWSDTSQFSADTIHIQLAEGSVQKILLYEQAFMVTSPDLRYFNQVKGKNITAFLEEDEIRRMFVEGNAETLYYALDDDDAYLGVNQTSCSEMLFLFAEKKLQEIRFYREPSGRLIPMDQADHEKLKLPGFRWEFERRPQSVDDLFKDN